MNVYLVSVGEYSDYQVMGVYSTLEKAQKACPHYASDAFIERYELDSIHGEVVQIARGQDDD